MAEASGRISAGRASPDDGLLLGFASQFLEFKQKVTATAGSVQDQAGPVTQIEASPTPLEEVKEEAPVDSEADGAETPAGEVSEEHEIELVDEAERPVQPQLVGGGKVRSAKRLGWTVRPIGGGGEIGGSAIVVQSPSGKDSVLLDAGQRVGGSFGATRDLDFHFLVAGVERLDAILDISCPD